MPRIFVIGIAGLLILGVVGGIGILISQLIGSDDEGNTEDTASPFGELAPADIADRQLEQPPLGETADPDNDGLTNAEEVFWKTNPTNPDTDGDGFLDGEEVAADHDPTKPAPDDLLATPGQPSNFVNNEDALQLLTIAPQFDQYFVDDLDIDLPDRNFTNDFKSEYTASDQTEVNMAEFADTVDIIQDLPRPRNGELPDLKPDNARLLREYVSVAFDNGVLANRSLYGEARYEIEVNDNTRPILSYGESVQQYRSRLLQATVPQSAERVHELLLGYAELLSRTFEQIGVWNDDPVKSLVASNQASIIDRKYYPIIRNEFIRLDSLQAQLAPVGQ